MIGASAGGIEAVGRVLEALPADFPAAVVIAQHIGSDRVSHLAAILERTSVLPVETLVEVQPLRAGTVFVVPANRHVAIVDHRVELRADERRGPKPSVDLLLASAAAEFGEALIAVVLSGTGSDGAAGAHVVKQHGGTVVIENPATAKHPGMPQSLAPSLVDVVADIDRIGEVLCDLLSGSPVPARPAADPTLDLLLQEVRSRSGIDFGSYRQPTILRRLQRRMAAIGARTMEEYLAHLELYPEEYERLASSFLIKVTEFFRDPETFEHLRQHLLPEIVSRAHAQDNQIRIWSAGCSTGEEAYSLAMVLSEVLGPKRDQFHVRVFATDADADAIAFARRGIYPGTALMRVDRELLGRYFTEEQGDYLIAKTLRSMIVFGQHDLGQRPPFPHVDLILCRNVLIYFTAEMQARALQLFAFSLRHEGYLVLGKSETSSPLAEFFQVAHPALKIYRRGGVPMLIPPARINAVRAGVRLQHTMRGRSGAPGAGARPSLPPNRSRVRTERWRDIFLHLPMGVVVVNAEYDIQFINAAARHVLGIHSVGIGEDLVHLAQTAPPRLIKEIVDACLADGAPVRRSGVEMADPAANEPRLIDLACHAYPPDRDHAPELAILAMVDLTEAGLARRQRTQETAQLRRERDELRGKLERVLAAHKEIERANDLLTKFNAELLSTNEDFLLDNEQVQAGREEVETLNEELQSTNEELETLNEELQATVEELNTANEDLQARSDELRELAAARAEQQRQAEQTRERLEVVLASMTSALLVVDGTGRTIIANQAYDSLFGSAGGFVAQDLDGRPLPAQGLPHLRAARGESFRMEFIVPDDRGQRRWFEAIGNPLCGRSGDGGPSEGGVVVIVDITDRSLRRMQDEFLAMASHELRTPLSALNLYVGRLAQVAAADGVDGRLRTIIEGLTAETRRLKVLVNDLTDVSRLETGQVSLQVADLDLGGLLRRVIDLTQPPPAGPVVACEVPPQPVRIRGDADRLEQVLTNLLENAIAYAAGTDRIDVRLRIDARAAEVSVRDYGRGIAPADLPHIFTRFYRGRRADQQGHSGLGLGLYIVKQLVVAHGGTIDVDSVEGKGTRFTIRLPLIAG